MRAAEVNCVGIWAKPLAIINGNIHKTLWIEEVNAIRPPPRDQIRVIRFVIQALTVCGESLIYPGLDRLIVGNLFEPPLMSSLMRGDEGKVVLRGRIILIVKIAAEVEEGGKLHAIVEVAHHNRQCLVRIRSEALGIQLQGFRTSLQSGLSRTFIEVERVTRKAQVT